MKHRIVWLVGTALGFASSSALACGEFFGTSVLERREHTLLTLWDASFALESSRLLASPEGLEWRTWHDDTGKPLAEEDHAEHLRRKTLTPEQRAAYTLRVEQGEASPSAALPATVAAYALGAHHYRNGEWQQAAGQFGTAAKGRSTPTDPWPLVAAYMVARSWLAHGDYDTAALAFDTVRTRAQRGEPDPLSLGARALSEAATAHQRAGRWVPAITLQMQQAALRVPGAAVSLRWRLEAAFRNDASLTQLLDDPVTRDAVILYALAFLPASADSSWRLPRHGLGWEAYWALGKDERAALPADLTADALMAAIERALENIRPEDVRGADRLAALLYRRGRYDAAHRIVETAQTPLSYWVRAKLALRDGDADRARDAYSHAILAFPDGEDWGNGSVSESWIARLPACQIQAEAAVLRLQRGDVVESLELFLRAGAIYWNDAAYVAERVLTLDELVGVVGRLPALKIARSVRTAAGPLDALETYERRGEIVDDPRAALSNVLARRLMRAGRFDEAIGHFTPASRAADARRYRDALARADSQTGTDKAQTLYDAAVIARRQGLNLLAFESSPDWAVHGGNYARPGNLEKLAGHVFSDDEMQYWKPQEDTDWIGEAERARVASHAEPSVPRFTYRLTAAELANRAADSLPRDSQAFAAVLCHATRWLLAREPALARTYYHRYRQEGRAQPWAGDFGKTCPAPDWAAAGSA